MEQYGYFSCLHCKVKLWIGRPVFKDGKIYYFRGANEQDPPNSRNLTLSRAAWKMLAEHHLHRLQVVLNTDREFEGQEEFVTIGSDRATDIPFEVYLQDWPG